jgi:RNA polymerase sigma factor (sigma-70 family)
MISAELKSPDETRYATAPMSGTTKIAEILIVDRHPLTRFGLSALIDSQPEMRVCGQAMDSAEVLETVRTRRPDLVVVELSRKDGGGIELIRQICCLPAETRVLAVSLYDEQVYAPRALAAGAIGFVSKDEECESVLQAIRSALEDRQARRAPHNGPTVVDSAHSEGQDIRSLLAKLTDRELEVFELLGHGLTVQQIAKRLDVSSNTVESYRERMKKKLLMKSGAELTVRAAQWVMET